MKSQDRFIDNAWSWGYRGLVSDIKEVFNRSTELTKLRKSALIGIDLGIAYGESTAALHKLCPNVKKIYVVEGKENREIPPENLRLLKNVQLEEFRGITILEFLGMALSSGFTADVIMICSVPSHNIATDNHYAQLAAVLNDTGMLWEVGDTNLNEYIMEKFFRKSPYSRSHINIWQKNQFPKTQE